MKLKKNKFIIGLSTTVLGSALAAGSQVAYADEPVDIPADSTPGVSETSYDDFTKEEDGSYLGGDEKSVETPSENDPQAKNVDEANSDTPAESTEGAEQTSSDANDAVPTNEPEENPTNVTEKDSDANVEAGAESSSDTESTSEEAVLTEPETSDKNSVKGEPAEETEGQTVEETKTEEDAEKDTKEPSPKTLAEGDSAIDTDVPSTETDENLDNHVDAGDVPENDADTAGTETTDETQARNEKAEELATYSADLTLDKKSFSLYGLSVEEGAPIGDLATSDPKADAGNITKEGSHPGTLETSLKYSEKGKAPSPQVGVEYKIEDPARYSDPRNFKIKISVDGEESQRIYTYFGLSYTLNNPPFNSREKNIPFKDYTGDSENNIPGKLEKYNLPAEFLTIETPARGAKSRSGSDGGLDKEIIRAINAEKKVTFGYSGSFDRDYISGSGDQVFSTAERDNLLFYYLPFPDENIDGGVISIDTSGLDESINPVNNERNATIKTGIKVNNLLDGDDARIVGKVYLGDQVISDDDIEVVYENGEIVLKPGVNALQSGSSIFNDPNLLKNKQELNVELYMKPREESDLLRIASNQYSPGSDSIFESMEDLAGDNGITYNKYNHANKIGEASIKIADRVNYKIKYENNGVDRTDDANPVTAGKDYTIKTISNHQGDNELLDFGEASDYKEVKRTLDKADIKALEDRGWKVTYTDEANGDITIKAPLNAEENDTGVIKVKYKYTNGSEENYTIEYVVEKEALAEPEYDDVEVKPGESTTTSVNLKTNNSSDPDIHDPFKYTIKQNKWLDEQGNIWTTTINNETGDIIATAPDGLDEPTSISIPVVAHFNDPDNPGKTYKKNTYAKVTAVPVATGSRNIKKVEILDFDTEVIQDDTINVGEIKVVQDGVKGSKTTFYKQDYINGEKTGDEYENTDREPVIVKPQNRIVRVGTKIESSTKEVPAPAGTDVVYDNTKPIGYREEVEGKDGTRTITTTTKLVDGKPVTEVSEEVTGVTNNKIIIGTKAIEDTTSEFTNNKVPADDVKINYVADPNMKLGETRDGEVTGGEIKTVVTTKYNPETGKVETTEETTVTPITKTVYTGTQDFTGTITHKENHEEAFEVEYVYSDQLNAGETKRIQEGKKGTYTVTYTHYIKNGEEVDKDGNKISADFKAESVRTAGDATQKEIIQIGTKPVEEVVEIPFNTEYIYDNTLAAGTTKTDKEGVVGYKKLVTTYDEANKTSETKVEEEKAAVNKVVRIGGKITGTQTVTESIPFEVEVETDPTLKKGEWRYAEDADGNKLTGQAGEQTRTLTIVNGAITETSDPTTTVNPINAKILVGSDDFTGNVTHEVTEAIPFEVKIEKDPNMKLGDYEVVTPGKAGSKTTKYTQAIKNGAADGELVPKELEDRYQAPTTEVIKVGSAPVADVTENVNEEIGVSLDFQFDENLDKGKYRTGELVKGKVENVVTTTFDPETGKMTSTETRKVTDAKQTIYIGSKGLEGDYTYTFEQEIPFDVQYVDDPTLDAGTTEVKQQGTAGTKTVTVTAKLVDGKAVEDSSKVTESVKQAATPQIVRVGTKTVADVKEVEVPYTSKTEADPEMSVGETRVVKGQTGKKTITVTTTRENGETTTTTKEVVTVEPTEEVVYYGTKPVVETQTVDTPYTTRTEADPTMAVGETEVVTKGQAGKKTITITTSLDENGKTQSVVTEKVDSDPVEEVIKFGTKVTNGNGATTTKVIEIPYETEVITDDNLEKGKRVVDQTGEKGERTITVNTPVTNGVAGDPVVTDEVTKEPVKEIIRIGTKPLKLDPNANIEEVELDTVYEVDYNLDADEEVVVDEGIPAIYLIDENGNRIRTLNPGRPRRVKVGIDNVGPEIVDVSELKFVEEDLKVTRIPDDSLAEGEEVVEQEGETAVYALDEDGKYIRPALREGKDRIVRFGTKKPAVPATGTFTRSEKIPFGRQIIEDASLAAGTYKIVQEGKVGSKEITYTLEDGKVLSEKLVSEVPAQDLIIHIGTKKTSSTDKPTVPSKPAEPTIKKIVSEIPYDTVFIYDNTIEAGKKVVTSPGQKGEKIVTITSKLVDGKIVTQTTEEIIKQPKTEFVRVGTRAPQYNGEDVVTNESKVLIPFETEIIYDDTLPLGQTEVVSEGRDGIQVVTITTRYQNGLVVDTTTDGYVEREAINKVVRVGTKTDGQAPTIDENTGIIDIPTTTEDNDHIIVIPEGAIDDENHVVVIPEEAENDEDDANKKNRPVNDNQVVKGTKNIKVSEDDANAVNIKRSAVSSTNPKTGITGTAGIISTLAISLAGITASRKKKENDEE